MTGETSQAFSETEAAVEAQKTPEELDAMVVEMMRNGTFLGSIWHNGESIADSTELTSPFAYSVSSGWRTVKYKKWYTREHAPKGPRDHTDKDEMILSIFRSSVADGDLKLYLESTPGPDQFGISEL